MDFHKANECPMREIKCPYQAQGCTWCGLSIELSQHEMVCPHVLVTCMWCLEEMEQFKMPGHVCPKVFGHDQCALQSIIFLMGGKTFV